MIIHCFAIYFVLLAYISLYKSIFNGYTAIFYDDDGLSLLMFSPDDFSTRTAHSANARFYGRCVSLALHAVEGCGIDKT